MTATKNEKKRIPTLYEPALYIPPSDDGSRPHLPAWDLREPTAVAFIGNRGDGKTLSLSYCAALAMANHIPVWLNYNVEFKLKRRDGTVEHLKSQPLDMKALYTFSHEMQGGLVGIDEYQYWADSYSTQSNRNKLLNYIWMQLRHRSLSFYFTVKDPAWVDKRMNFETDLVVKCTDLFKKYPEDLKKGHKICWDIYRWDVEWTGYEFMRVPKLVSSKELKAAQVLFGIYNTYEIIDPLQPGAMGGVELDLEKTKVSNKSEIQFASEIYEPRLQEICEGKTRIWQHEIEATLGNINSKQLRQAMDKIGSLTLFGK